MPLTEQARAALEMARLGLYRVLPAERCKLCRTKSEWLHKDRLYCFADCCSSSSGIKVVRPLAPFVGKLTDECDPSEPELFVKLAERGFYRVAEQGSVWDRATMSEIEFQFIRESAAKVYLNGVQLN